MTETRSSSSPVGLSFGQRALSLVEFLAGAAIVVAHNVFRAVPNEVPILFVLGLASVRLREGNWRAVGLALPSSWWRTILMAFATAAVILVMGEYVTDPLASALGLRAAKTAGQALGQTPGDVRALVKALVIVWTFAAFGEEISYRRYLLGRAADVGDRSNTSYWVALPIVSALFGIGHYYQGPAGIFGTACDGFVIGAAYLLAGRNLWVAVLAHGIHDTVAIGAVFFGLAD